jgi:hypothetical protein
MQALNQNQLDALRAYANHAGYTWKSKLCRDWEKGATHGEFTALLRQVRNLIGPSGLYKLRLPTPSDRKPACSTADEERAL